MTIRSHSRTLIISVVLAFLPSAALAAPNAATIEKNLAKLIDVDFKEKSLVSVFENISTQIGTEIKVDWDDISFRSARDQMVSMTLKGVPARRILEVLGSCIAAKGNNYANIIIKDGVIELATWNELSAPKRPKNTKVTYKLQTFARLLNESEPEIVVEYFNRLITDNVGQPGEWESNGGALSSLELSGKNVSVTTTPDNHRQIEALLNAIDRRGGAVISSKPSKPSLIKEKIMQRLQRKVTVAFDDLPTPKALERLQEATGVQILFLPALLDSKPGKHSVNVKDVKGEEALAKCFQPLIVVADEGFVRIESEGSFKQDRIIWVYNVSKWAKSEEKLDALCQAIVQNDRPKTWAAFGGDVASLSLIGPSLIVRAPEDYHVKLSAFLKAR